MELFTPFLSLQHDRRSRTSIAGTVCEGSVIFGTYRNPATSADSAADVTCISGRGKSVEHTDLLLLSSPIGLPQHWPFIKMHGLENYFVILDRRDGNKPLNVEDIVRICSNNTGVGGEQLLTIEPASDEGRGGEDFQYRRQGSRGMRQRHSLHGLSAARGIRRGRVADRTGGGRRPLPQGRANGDQRDAWTNQHGLAQDSVSPRS